MMGVTVFALWAMAKSRKMRIFPLILFVLLVGVFIEQWLAEPHYAAPALAATVAVVLYGLRLLWTWRPKGVPVGPMLVRSAVMLLLAQSLLATGELALNPYRIDVTDPQHYIVPQLERARLTSELERIPGNHLIFLRFQYKERGGIFWLFNDPDLNNSRIIWAHDMGIEENQRLMKLYPNRHVWLVYKDDSMNRLTPYPDSSEGFGALQAGIPASSPAQASTAQGERILLRSSRSPR
jgi:uncharacterized SAM-binding protein YcdF (DUF218 family)